VHNGGQRPRRALLGRVDNEAVHRRYDVVASDLDGTVVREDGSISERTRRAFETVEAAGATLVLVTGRPPRWLAGVAEATGHHGLAICANGALVVDLRTDEIVTSRGFDAEVVHDVVERLREAIPGVAFAVESGAHGFGHEPAYRPRYTGDTRDLCADLDVLLTRPVVKLLVRHEQMSSDELHDAAREVIDEGLGQLTHSMDGGLLEVSAAGVTKATSLASFCQARDVGPERVVAFGDMPNDLPMLGWAGHAVAVANAHPAVLAAADEVAPGVADDGVARVLERLFGSAVTRTG
jgi:Cof subfamily protein (haloacid dehalogenase superfamily)